VLAKFEQKKVLLGTPAEEPERLLWTKKKEQQSQWYLVDLLCNGVAVVRKEEERNTAAETMGCQQCQDSCLVVSGNDRRIIGVV
jgi:hypothetical protein